MRLEELDHLTHLYLTNKNVGAGKGAGTWPFDADSRWEGVSSGESLARRYAFCCKYKCPSLQYIRINDWSWQFIIRQDNAQPMEENSKEKVEDDDLHDFKMVTLHDLEWDEVLAIDMFACQWSENHSGLPRRNLYGPPGMWRLK